MANYNQVSRGSGDKNTVLTLQRKLNEYGAGLEEDGIFGAKTDTALRNYQSNNGLQVDGIAGEKTWAKLMGNSNAGNQQAQQPQQTAPAAPDYSAYQYDSSNNEAYNYANTMLEQARQNISAPTYNYDALQEAYDKAVNRDKFKYDLNGDAMYQQYKDQFTTQGKLASLDAMGQAAALTGGYGSSFAQSAGQQAYQGYLQHLNEVVPELYGMAYDQYQQEGQDLLNRYAMVKEMEDTRYGVAQDQQNAAWQALNYWQGVADSEYDKDFNLWYTAQQLGAAADETAYSRQQTEYSNLVNKIASTGYVPSKAEREAVGMSLNEANSWAESYKKQVAYSSNSGSSSKDPEYAVFDRDAQIAWTEDWENALATGDLGELKNVADRMEQAKIDPVTVADWFDYYSTKLKPAGNTGGTEPTYKNDKDRIFSQW